ncbi:MAG: hypothetical protein JO312_15605 [Hyphomicrobiales bacterium]|nr:hypothetical protein [Hyphomicrobiales bacterium]
MSDFRVYSTDGQIDGGGFYFIESTAPDAVEGDPSRAVPTPPGLHAVDTDQAVKDIAAFLTPEEPGIDASLVVMVHGFNTPRERVLALYEKARDAVIADGKIFDPDRRRIVCIGYRWPSEGIWSDLGSTVAAMRTRGCQRVLSDVFDPDAILTKLSGAPRSRTAGQATDDQVPGTIGHVFDLMRFVLASPDIPGETLLANRANFLASSLRRFKEAYLFSSEGDGVLRSISTIVNYFTFPTRNRNYGYRLGNAEILTSNFPKPVVGDVLKLARVGRKTIPELSTETAGGNPSEVAMAFTYFDCTDYKDGEPPKGMLTGARNCKRNDPGARIPLYEHIKLLVLYALSRIDIHGGYFDGPVTQGLIYRLACLGFTGTAAAYGNVESLLNECAKHQIRVMPTERLAENARRAPERMDISPASPAA